jgi:hypothetical protein
VFRIARLPSPPRVLFFAAAFAAFVGCSSGDEEQEPPSRSDSEAALEHGSEASIPTVTTLPPGSRTTAGERVLIAIDGAAGQKEERWVDASEAVSLGYTLIDLGDDWTPYIFEEQRDAQGRVLPNRYRRVFIGLENDALDGDGQPLEAGEKNYLELYGIFPSVSVIRERFLSDETRTCIDEESRALLTSVKSVGYVAPVKHKRNIAKYSKLEKELERARTTAKVETLAELAEKTPKLAAKIKDFEDWTNNQKVVAAAERRLICEGFLQPEPPPGEKRKGPKHTPGFQDEGLQAALRAFQQKHMIYDGHSLRPRTLTFLARSTIENDHESLRRALRERVVAAADVIEDGSTHGKNGAPTYTSASGEELPMQNLADEFTDAVLSQLGLDKPEAALAFFKRHDAAAFEKMRAGVKLASRPEYYSPHMELSIVIDRGDVWYDPPFDDKDRWKAQWRQRYPSLTLYTEYQGKKLPLVRWRTTIGGWRSEQAANGYEYYKYKGSDTGPRVLRKIVSGPVWIAPESEPIRGLVKAKKVNGHWQSGVNYDALGPGYLSAYGVVAGYFVIPGEGDAPDIDRGIRAHGSSNYLSIYSESGYSHGCHRLPNNLAIRLYDFLLQHRTMIVKGDSPMDFSRQFLWQDHVYDMRIPYRGFEFQLDPPIAVSVLEGTIKGTARSPIEGNVPKPGKRYPPPEEEPVEGTPVDAVTTASRPAPNPAAARGGP